MIIEIQVVVFARIDQAGGEIDREGTRYRQAKLDEMAKQGWMIAGVAGGDNVQHVYLQRVKPGAARWGAERDGVTWRERPTREWCGDPIPAGGGAAGISIMHGLDGQYHRVHTGEAYEHGSGGRGPGSAGTEVQVDPNSAACANGGFGGGQDASPQGCAGIDS